MEGFLVGVGYNNRGFGYIQFMTCTSDSDFRESFILPNLPTYLCCRKDLRNRESHFTLLNPKAASLEISGPSKHTHPLRKEPREIQLNGADLKAPRPERALCSTGVRTTVVRRGLGVARPITPFLSWKLPRRERHEGLRTFLMVDNTTRPGIERGRTVRVRLLFSSFIWYPKSV